jgi:hypothetical protein
VSGTTAHTSWSWAHTPLIAAAACVCVGVGECVFNSRAACNPLSFAPPQALFHTPFLARARQLVTDELQSACDALARPLDAALLSAACAPPEPAGLLRPDVWPAAKAVVVAAGDGPEDHPARRVSGTLVGAAPGMTAEQSEQGDCKGAANMLTAPCTSVCVNGLR